MLNGPPFLVEGLGSLIRAKFASVRASGCRLLTRGNGTTNRVSNARALTFTKNNKNGRSRFLTFSRRVLCVYASEARSFFRRTITIFLCRGKVSFHVNREGVSSCKSVNSLLCVDPTFGLRTRRITGRSSHCEGAWSGGRNRRVVYFSVQPSRATNREFFRRATVIYHNDWNCHIFLPFLGRRRMRANLSFLLTKSTRRFFFLLKNVTSPIDGLNNFTIRIITNSLRSFRRTYRKNLSVLSNDFREDVRVSRN